MYSRGFCRLIVLLVISLSANGFGQNQPATQPGAGGRGRGPAVPNGQGPISRSPRDDQPFSNSDLAKINPNLPTLFIAGDSTAATGDPSHRGWAAVLIDYLDPEKVVIVNRSQGGINFPNFYASRWPAMVEAMKPGDFVVIELGHNGGHEPGMGDETREQAGRGGGPATAVHTYGWYTRKFVTDAKSKGTVPIVSSTSIRNWWTNPNAEFNEAYLVSKKDNYDPKDDRVERGMGNILEGGERTMLVWARQVAKEEKVPFVDHSNIAADLYEKLGRENTGKWHSDRTHFSTEGAIVQAELFIAGLRAQPEIALNKYLNDKGKAIAPYVPKGK